ncbi:MAG: DUF2085 domain-containing protein [Candidatus Omnitrophica bacterium]|nr:DUF2085 domain-containing protein [Candidatus Omnitrophota bacterium]
MKKEMMKFIKGLFSYIGRSPLCNKNRTRAPKILGFCFILCWRCSGLIIGGAVGGFLYNLGVMNYKNSILFIIVLSIPFFLDVFIQFILKNESTNVRRFLTGALFGIALANFRPI